jgi:Glycosyltransferase family 87
MKSSTRSQHAIAAWVIALVVVAIVVSFPRMSGKLYPTFVAAGEHFQHGEPVYGWFPESQDQYRYSPLVAATFAPWSHVPTPVGAILWRWLQALLLLVALRAWSRVALPRIGWPTVALASLPLVLGNVYNAQLNPLVLTLMLAGLTAFAHGRLNLAAAAIAGAAIFKVYPLALGLLLCTLEPRRFTPRLVVALAIGAGLPFALQSPDYVRQQYVDWFQRMGGEDRTNDSIHDGYHDFQRLLRSWGVPTALSTYRAIEVGVGVAMAGALVLGRRHGLSRHKQVQLCAGFGLVWCTLFGPATESATYMLLAPLAAQAVAMAAGRGSMERLWVFGAYALQLSVPIVQWFPRTVSDPYRSLLPQAHGALLLLVWILWQSHFGTQTRSRFRPLRTTIGSAARLGLRMR